MLDFDNEDDYLNEEDSFDDIQDDENSQPVEIPKEVRNLRTQSFDKSVRDLVASIREGDIDLDPDYQRNYLWDNKKASLLIESILLNIPIPVIYVAENDQSQWNVIDGLQRLYSLFRFYNNDFKLTKLEVLSELNGLTYFNLPPKAQRMLSNGMFRVVVLLAESHPEIKYDVFMRLNTGAIKLNEQELRNCLYRGSLNNFIKLARENEKFLKCLKLAKPHKRFVDAEIILRFLALHEAVDIPNRTIHYPGRMKNFLNDFMEKHQNASDQKISEFDSIIKKTMDNLFLVYGDAAFRRPNRQGQFETRINRSLIDVMMLSFSRMNNDYCLTNKERLFQILLNMCQDPVFEEAITLGTSDSKRLEQRIFIGLERFGVL